jgi:hypothetical protein
MLPRSHDTPTGADIEPAVIVEEPPHRPLVVGVERVDAKDIQPVGVNLGRDSGDVLEVARPRPRIAVVGVELVGVEDRLRVTTCFYDDGPVVQPIDGVRQAGERIVTKKRAHWSPPIPWLRR